MTALIYDLWSSRLPERKEASQAGAFPRNLSAIGFTGHVTPDFLEHFLNGLAGLLYGLQKVPRERAVALTFAAINSDLSRRCGVGKECACRCVHPAKTSIQASGANQVVVAAGIKDHDVYPLCVVGLDHLKHLKPSASVIRLIGQLVLKLDV